MKSGTAATAAAVVVWAEFERSRVIAARLQRGLAVEVHDLGAGWRSETSAASMVSGSDGASVDGSVSGCDGFFEDGHLAHRA